MTATILDFTPPIRRISKSDPDAIAYGCSLPCWAAMECGAEICGGCQNSDPEPPEAA